MNLSEQAKLYTGAQKFEDLMRAIATMTKKSVDAKIADKAVRKGRQTVKQK